MAGVYTTAVEGWTPVAHADGASALASNSYHGIRVASASGTIRTTEVYVAGEAGASSVSRPILRRTSTLVATPTNVAPAPSAKGQGAASYQKFVAATTGPTLASTEHLLSLAINAFGGIIRWVAYPGEEIYSAGTTQPDTEQILDVGTGSGVSVLTTMIKTEELTQ